MIKCVKCGFPKYNNSIGVIWLSEDGYCSVCNNQFKDRKKLIGGMDNFVKTTIVKEGTYNHLDKWGRKISKANLDRLKVLKYSNPSTIHINYVEFKEKSIRKIDEYL